MSTEQQTVGVATAATPAVPAMLPDAALLRRVFGSFATGVTVITVGGAAARGMTANSFSSVSLDPPLVLACVGRDASMHASLVASGTFGISVLAAHQEDVAKHFAVRGQPAGPGQFRRVAWLPGARTGVPLIRGALAWFECSLWQAYDGGDHSIFVGRLLSAGRSDPAALGGSSEALVFHGGHFRRLQQEES